MRGPGAIGRVDQAAVGLWRRERIRIGELPVDVVRFDEALDAIEAMVEAGAGGSVFTPNVDHVMLAEGNAAFRRAYQAASLCLADGKPLIWASRLLGRPLPEKVSGSDLLLPLMRRAAARRWRVYLLGGAPEVTGLAARRLREQEGVEIVGVDTQRLPATPDPGSSGEVMARIRGARPDVVLVALGAPKQELWIHALSGELRPAVALGIGGALGFIAGTVRRAPRWVSEAGLEWAFRLVQEPGRLWRRYLVRDPAFLRIVLRMLRERRDPVVQPQ